jgi:hypothetical protein
MFWINKQAPVQIVEDALRLLEPHTMLYSIALILGFVPIEPQLI